MKKLSRGNGIIGGVCEGLGEYFEVDPILLRLLFVITFFTPLTPAVLIYLVFWVIIKKKQF
jgi:phage shock protein PspC (stress-responsive transcriptional regulator)